MELIDFSESARMVLRRIRVSLRGIRHYSGNAEQICQKILKDCYNQNKNYFMVSHGHFCQFYARDFGWCTEALLSLGYREEVISTLDYALGVFQRHGRIKQAISPGGKAFTFPSREYSPDALAFIIRSLKLAKAAGLVEKYKEFLNQEIQRYYDLVIDKTTGLVRKDQAFSSMKDYSVRQSSCYDNVMTGMLAKDLTELGLVNPFRKWDYSKLLLENFWNGNYFVDDLSGDRMSKINKIICGDANVVPFWSGLVNDKALLKKSVAAIRKEGLDKPFPLKYTEARFKEQKMTGLEFIAGNYERDTVWSHVGFMYIKIVAQVDKKLAKEYLDQYTRQIELHKNFLEVYDKDGKPFKTLVYYADDSMLWCANYLYLKKILS